MVALRGLRVSKLVRSPTEWLFVYDFLALVPAVRWVFPGRGRSAGPNVDEEIGNQHPDQGAGFLLMSRILPDPTNNEDRLI
jgi:hypothetical protein